MHNLRFVDEFLDTPPKAYSVKENIDKLYFIKIKIFFSAKYILKRKDRQVENICKSRFWQRISIQTIKQILQTQQNKINNPIKQIGENSK